MTFREFVSKKEVEGKWLNVYFEQDSWTTCKIKVHEEFIEVLNPDGAINAIRLACISSVFVLMDKDSIAHAEKLYSKTLLEGKGAFAKDTTRKPD